MLAAQSQNIQPLNMDTSMNPLMAAAAAKRAKKDKANAGKRKLLPTEDAPGGLLIVHTPEHPDSSQPRASSSQPTHLSQSKPPSKKFRADSQPPAGPSRSTKPPSNSQSSQNAPRKPPTSSRLLEDDHVASHSDAEVERDVRAMEDEADRLRRQSRARALIDQTLLASQSSSQGSSGADNSMFNFPPPPSSTSNSQPRRAPAASGSSKPRSKLTMTATSTSTTMTMDVDTQVPIPQNETPQQQRNKRLREGAMAAIREDQEGEEEGRGRDASRGDGGPRQRSGSRRRRASSLSRGKRISTSYQQTGVITQPHNTVSEASFYKHIDADLPEVERIRQLLIWCAMRAASTYNKPPLPPSNPLASSSTALFSSSTTSAPTTAATATHSPPLPPLSERAQAVLKKAQDTFVKMLAEKQIDLSGRGPSDVDTGRGQGGDLKENEQNVRNRLLEGTYSGDIQRAQAEEEAWKKASYEYDAYSKKLQASLEKRKKGVEVLRAPRPPPVFTRASKAKTKGRGKGKGRASIGNAEGDVDMDDDESLTKEDEEQEDDERTKEEEEEEEKATTAWLSVFPQPHELPPDFQRGADLARSILLRSVRRPPSNARRKSLSLCPSSPSRPRGSLLPPLPSSLSSSTSAIPSSSSDIEDALLSALPTLQYKLDLLHTHLNAARATTAVCERLLDERYRILNRVLDARMRSVGVGSGLEGGASSSSAEPGGGAAKTSVLTRYITPRAQSPSSASSHARALYPSSTLTAIPGRPQPLPPPPPSLPSSSHLPNPHTLLRALTRVDAARPPAQISDAARRAAREVQRAEESGMGPIAGERRVTLLPGMASGVTVPATPRKGTLAVPGTPGRRTPARERTPGR